MANNKTSQKADILRRQTARDFSDTIVNVQPGAEKAFAMAVEEGTFDCKTVVIFPDTEKSAEVLDI